MFRRLTRRSLSAIYRGSALSTAAAVLVTEQQHEAGDQALNLNKAVSAVKEFFPLNEPHVGSAYTNTVCSSPR